MERTRTRTIDVLVVTSPGCHLCDDALGALAELALDHPLAIREAALDSEEGRAVLARFRPPMPPFVVVDGELFSSGRLPRTKLRRWLESGKVVA